MKRALLELVILRPSLSRRISKCRVQLLILGLLLSLPAFAVNTITGTVQNLTKRQPAVGDEVLLLRLTQGMLQEARTTTDRRGAFTLNVFLPGAPHLIRVIHQGVNYDQTMSGSGPMRINVYDTVSKIRGLSGSLGIVKIEADEKLLKVAEMYAISNVSSPLMTQSGPHNFDISLPADAVLDSIQARGPGGIWVNISPVPQNTDRFGINFPFRPGDTLLKFAYHLSNTGTTRLHLRMPYPIRNFGVMHPPSISFRALQPGSFVSPGQTNGLVIELAVKQPVVGEVPGFEVSGIGMVADSTAAQGSPSVSASATHDETAGRTAATWRSGLFWTIFGSGLLVLAVFVWCGRRRAIVGHEARIHLTPIEGLKDQLFRLESERLRGSISGGEYASSKRALSETMQHELTKRSIG